MKNTVIFDLDGTILNTLPDIQGAVNHALHDFGLDGITLEETRLFVGSGLMNTLNRAIELKSRGFVIGKDAKMRMYDNLIAYYDAHPDMHTYPYEGIYGMMEELKERNIKMAVLSNKDETLVPYLVRHFFPGIPFALVRGHRIGALLKPDPALIDSILEEIGSSREETLLVGDSMVDYQTGVNANLDTLIVSYGFRTPEELSGCNCPVLATVEELRAEILGRV